MKKMICLVTMLLLLPGLYALSKEDVYGLIDANSAKIKSLSIIAEYIIDVEEKDESYSYREGRRFFFKNPKSRRRMHYVEIIGEQQGGDYAVLFDGKDYYSDYKYGGQKLKEERRPDWEVFAPLNASRREKAKLVSFEAGLAVLGWQGKHRWRKDELQDWTAEIDTERGVVTRLVMDVADGAKHEETKFEYQQLEGAWILSGAEHVSRSKRRQVKSSLEIKQQELNGELDDELFRGIDGGRVPEDRGAARIAQPQVVVDLPGAGKSEPLLVVMRDELAGKDRAQALWDKLSGKLPGEVLPAEGYLLELGPEGALVVTGDELGAIRARQTMRSLPEGKALRIADWPAQAWRGFHVIPYTAESLPVLKMMVREFLAPLKCNLFILQVDYCFDYKSHPEVREKKELFTVEHIRELKEVCDQEGIRLAPMLNCFGHQSWKLDTHGLLVAHPEYEEIPDAKTPQTDPGSDKFYCRSWCPLHPEVNPLVFDLMDELVDAFQSELFHIGMDEVFVIASDSCPRCKGKAPAELFARVMNDMHGHLKKRGQTMMIWGDRLLDAEETDYGVWEAAGNSTQASITMIPKDIVICDWHYEAREDYPSLEIFRKQGFKIMPTTYSDPFGARLFMDASRQAKGDAVLGPIATCWSPILSFARGALTEKSYRQARPKGGKDRAPSGWGFRTVMTVRQVLARAWNPASVGEAE